MTKAYISEYTDMASFSPGGQFLQAGREPAIAVQLVDYGAGHAESAAFNAKTRFIRLHTDAICSYKFSTAGTAAATTDPRMAANQTEFFGVIAGDKVSIISNT